MRKKSIRLLRRRDYKRLLLYALREGKKMLASRDYEFVKVFEVSHLDWLTVL